EGQNQSAMSRSFVIVSKSAPVVADLNRRFIKFDKLQRLYVDLIVFDFVLLENRIERVLREDMFDVGDEQLLMLLLVMDSKGQDRFNLAKQFLIGIGNQSINVWIDRDAIFLRLFIRWLRVHSTVVAGMRRGGGVV